MKKPEKLNPIAAEAMKKFIFDYPSLKKITEGLRTAGNRIIVTIGTWDVLHVGHVRYLFSAKKRGDILIAGVDSDQVVKKTKGPHRPMIRQEERMEMLSYQLPVDFVTLIDDIDQNGSWQCGLLKFVKPDIFVAVEGDSYSPRQKREIKKHCGDLVVLPRQAENTSSTAIIQGVLKQHFAALVEILDARKTP